eukprot:4146652-Amphidinium_carterae.1
MPNFALYFQHNNLKLSTPFRTLVFKFGFVQWFHVKVFYKGETYASSIAGPQLGSRAFCSCGSRVDLEAPTLPNMPKGEKKAKSSKQEPPAQHCCRKRVHR